jgi:hypothetical protein
MPLWVSVGRFRLAELFWAKMTKENGAHTPFSSQANTTGNGPHLRGSHVFRLAGTLTRKTY